MFLGGAANLYTGAVASEERWQRRRADARQAFVEFQKMNPNASYDDYRSYADQLSEGNAFIRGGIPPEQMLRSLAENNAQQKVQQEMSRNLNMLQQRAQIAGQIDALATDSVLDIDDDNKLLNSLAGQLGYDPNNPATESILGMVQSQYPQGFGGLREQQRTALFEKYLPQLEKVIVGNPNLTDEQVMSLVPGLGQMAQTGSRNRLVGELLNGARTQAEKKKQNEISSQIDSLVKDGRTQIDTTYQYTLPDGVDASVAAGARKQLDPYLTSRTEQRDAEASRQATSNMYPMAQSIVQMIGGPEALLSDPAAVPQLKEQLKTAAKQAGITASNVDIDSTIEIVVNQLMSAGKRALQSRQAQSLSGYEEDVQEYLSRDNPDVSVADIPTPPTFSDPALQAQAAQAYERASGEISRRTRRLASEDESEAISAISDKFVADEALIQGIANGTISDAEIASRVHSSLSLALRGNASTEALTAVLENVARRVSLLENSRIGQETTKFIESQKATLEEMEATSITSMNGLIDGMFSPDDNPQANAQLKALVNEQLLGAAGVRANPAVTRVLQNYLTHDFLASVNGNLGEMVRQIQSDPAFLAAAKMDPSQNLVEGGFPYGNKRGSKANVIDKSMSDFVGVVEPVEIAVQQALDTLSSGDESKFFKALSKAEARIKQEAASNLSRIKAFKMQSSFWSTDGEITDSEYSQYIEGVQSRMDKALTQLEDIRKRGEKMIIGMNKKPEDAIAEGSPRLSESSGPSVPDGFSGAMDRLLDRTNEPKSGGW